MPSRYVREGWNDSDRIRRAGEPAEVMLLRLILVADDYARFDGRASVIRNRCWPVEDEEAPGAPPRPSVAEVEQRLAALERESLIFRYVVGGKPYVYIPNFQQRTRAQKSKYPAPNEHAGHMTDKGPTDDGHASGRWRTPDGQPPDTCPTHDGGPQAVSNSNSGLDINNHRLKKPQENAEPVDNWSANLKTPPNAPRKATATAKPPAGLKPPAAMTPEEREAAGIAAPPPDLIERFTKPAPAAEHQQPGKPVRRRYEPEPRDDDAPTDDELLEQARTHATATQATRALDITPPTDWENTPQGIEHAGATLGMKRMPFEEDPDYANRIRSRIALG